MSVLAKYNPKHLIHQESDKIKETLENQTVQEYWQQNERIGCQINPN